jgi:hypothetical protein
MNFIISKTPVALQFITKQSLGISIKTVREGLVSMDSVAEQWRQVTGRICHKIGYYNDIPVYTDNFLKTDIVFWNGTDYLITELDELPQLNTK